MTRAGWSRAMGETSPVRGILLAVGLVAFVALDVALVAAALHSTSPTPMRQAGPIPTFTSTPRPATTPSPSSTPSSATTTDPAATRSSTGPARFLSVASAKVALRASAGACAGSAPVVERTTDGGTTWVPVDLGVESVGQVVALDAGTRKSVLTGLAVDSCVPRAAASFTGGEFWADAPGDLASAAYVTPSDETLHLASGNTRSPCPAPVSVVEWSGGQAVSCADTFAVRTGKNPWQLVKVDHLAGFTTLDSTYLLAVTGVAGCDGVSIESMSTPVTPDSTASSVGCAPATGTLDPSTVALGTAGDDVWLWAGSDVTVSTDEGKSW